MLLVSGLGSLLRACHLERGEQPRPLPGRMTVGKT